VAPLFYTNFAADTSPYFGSDYGSWPGSSGHVTYPGWFSSEPHLRSAYLVNPYAGLGRGGKNGLYAPEDDGVGWPNDANAQWSLNGPAERYQPLVPVEYAAGAVITFSIKFDPSVVGPTYGDYYPDYFEPCVLYDPSGSGSQALGISIRNDGYGPSNWSNWYWEVWWPSPEWPAYEDITTGISDWNLLADGSWRDFVVTYVPSTVLSFTPGSAAVVANDGSLHITINGVTLMSRSGLYLCANKYGYAANTADPRSADNLNRPANIAISGMVGVYDYLSYELPALPSPSPSVSPSSSRSRSLSPSPSVSPSPAPESVSPHPLVWVEWEPGDGQVLGSAEVTLPDPAGYHGGLKRARLLRVSEIRRALSGPHGDYESGRFDVTLADTDRVVRGLLGSAPTSYWTRRPMRVQLIDDAGRRQLATPRMIAVGSVESPTFTDSEVTLRAVDAVGAQRWMDAKSG
jgi:hypothetical protein